MATHRWGRTAAPTFGLLALVGAWSGHALEYIRVAPGVGPRDALLGPLHRGYMLPLGLVLLALALAGGTRWLVVWAALGRRLDDARARLRLVWRGAGRAGDAAPAPAAPTWGARLSVLALGLATAQTAFYTAQENLEAWATGAPPPGLAVLAGRHWAAPLVHLGVAALIAAVVVVLGRLLARRVGLVRRCERFVAGLLRSIAGRIIPSPPCRWPAAPLERHGTHLWCRPPPLPAR